MAGVVCRVHLRTSASQPLSQADPYGLFGWNMGKQLVYLDSSLCINWDAIRNMKCFYAQAKVEVFPSSDVLAAVALFFTLGGLHLFALLGLTCICLRGARIPALSLC
jgi:hypothetical protein